VAQLRPITCERCGVSVCRHMLIPMKRGVFAMCCEPCANTIYDLYRVGKSLNWDLFPALEEKTHAVQPSSLRLVR